MQVDLGKIYNDTITVINRLDAKDSSTKNDTYYATIIPHCMWSVKTIRAVDANGNVAIDEVHQVQIPEAENYLPYREWKKLENRNSAFTLRTGDYIVLGELTEEVTASNVKSLTRDYEPDAFQIQAFRDATKGAGFEHSTNGALRFTEVYYVEG